MGARRQAGFTLVELVMVITLTGVLAVFVLPRVLDLELWRLRAYADELRAQVQWAQRLALQQRRELVATIDGNGVTLAWRGGTLLRELPCPPALGSCIAETTLRSAVFNDGNRGATATSTGAALPLTLRAGGEQVRLVLEADSGLLRSGP